MQATFGQQDVEVDAVEVRLEAGDDRRVELVAGEGLARADQRQRAADLSLRDELDRCVAGELGPEVAEVRAEVGLALRVDAGARRRRRGEEQPDAPAVPGVRVEPRLPQGLVDHG